MTQKSISILTGALVLSTALSIIPSSSNAATEAPAPNTRQWEVTGGSSGSFNLEKPKLLNVGGNIGYFIENSAVEISFGGEFASFHDSSFTTATNLFLAAGPIVNFNHEDLENSAYLGARIGLVRTHSGLYDVTTSFFAWQAFLGKRIRITDHVSWAPEIDYFHQGDSTMSDGTRIYGSAFLTAAPLRFSFLF